MKNTGQGNRIERSRKPVRCPSCGASPVATIMYGLPDCSEELFKKMLAGEIVSGGCIVMDDAPLWQCLKCKQLIHKRRKGRKAA